MGFTSFNPSYGLRAGWINRERPVHLVNVFAVKRNNISVGAKLSDLVQVRRLPGLQNVGHFVFVEDEVVIVLVAMTCPQRRLVLGLRKEETKPFVGIVPPGGLHLNEPARGYVGVGQKVIPARRRFPAVRSEERR